MDTDVAVDEFRLLQDGAADLRSFLRALAKASKEGKGFDVAKAREIVTSMLTGIIDSCLALAQGDDDDRKSLCHRAAEALVSETKRKERSR